jgi:hypothetical protein
MRNQPVPTLFSPFFRLAAIGMLAAFAAAPAVAADWELTPTVAHRSTGYECTGGEGVIATTSVFPPPTCAFVHAEAEDSAAFGVVLGVGVGRHLQVELLASRQETEIDQRLLPGVQTLAEDFGLFAPLSTPDFAVTHLQAGVARSWGEGTARPFVGVAVGGSRVDSDDPQRGIDFEEDAFSASVGAGFKMYFSERLGLRLEARGYWVDLDSDLGGDFTQSEAGAGLILRF